MDRLSVAVDLLNRSLEALPETSLKEEISDFLGRKDPISPAVSLDVEDLSDEIEAFVSTYGEPTTKAVLKLRILVARTKRLFLSCTSNENQVALSSCLATLGTWHRKVANSQGYVFGLSSKHITYVKSWKALEEAYIFLDIGIEAWDYLSKNSFDVPMKTEITDLAWLAQTHFHRVCAQSNLSFVEVLQKDLRQQMLEAKDAGLITLPLKIPSDPQSLLGKLRSRKDTVTQSSSLLEKSQEVEALKVALENAIYCLDLTTVYSITEDLLTIGIAPSDLWLRSSLNPLVDELTNLEGGSSKFHNLMGYLREEPKEVTKKVEEVLDEDYLRIREEVRKFSRGKTMLVVGSRTDANATRGYLRELELKEVVWPGFEKNDIMGVYDAYVTKADIVIRIVKFARTWTKSVIENAANQGKITVVLQAGYNARQVVSAFHEQVVLKANLANICN